MRKQTIALILESTEENEVFGRIFFEDNLLVESASSIELLETKMKKLLFKFHALKPIDILFDIQYDITGLFDHKNYLNASVVADIAGISRGLMRQYIAGIKYPSTERTLTIQKAVRQIGKELQKIKVVETRR